MSQVVSFEDYTPAPRFDAQPWTEVRIEESSTTATPSSTTVWTLIDTIALSPVDADPAAPATRSVTTENANDESGRWYRLIFADAGGDTLQPTFPVQNSEGAPPYASAAELAGILKVDLAKRRAALERVLTAAAIEIDAELDRVTPFDTPPALVVEVNLERAVEHWQQAQSPFGLIGLAGESVPAFANTDTWQRHAFKLAPLKQQWGIA